MWICGFFLFLACLHVTDAICMPFTWHCGDYGSCSHQCGGGTQTKRCVSCVRDDVKHESRDCNKNCYNGGVFNGGCICLTAWRTGRCCSGCKDTNINHCLPNKYECGGNPDNIRCTQCANPYYSAGYGKGCLECPAIKDCDKRQCTNQRNTKCLKCTGDNVFFITPDGTKCQGMCAGNNHYSWPGTCGDELPENCKCDPGLKIV